MTVKEAVDKWIEEKPEKWGRSPENQIRFYQAWQYSEMIQDESTKHLAEYVMSGIIGYEEYALGDLIEELETDFEDDGDLLWQNLEEFVKG